MKRKIGLPTNDDGKENTVFITCYLVRKMFRPPGFQQQGFNHPKECLPQSNLWREPSNIHCSVRPFGVRVSRSALCACILTSIAYGRWSLIIVQVK